MERKVKTLSQENQLELALQWVIVADNYFTGSKDNLKKWIGHPRFELIRHGEFTMLELAETVKELINPNVEIKTVDNTPDDPRQRKPDITKAKELLGWEPKVKLRDGLPLMEEDFRLRLGVPKNN
uniref:UDP-glucuronic acid decarboxylase 1 n=1 Tax=Cajanus cajan TaxID=3821 RepID=A0A151TMF5_CAJCA|nr:UDP-glucuronic acid decarboxylase 1 [Cajanus cajan]